MKNLIAKFSPKLKYTILLILIGIIWGNSYYFIRSKTVGHFPSVNADQIFELEDGKLAIQDYETLVWDYQNGKVSKMTNPILGKENYSLQIISADSKTYYSIRDSIKKTSIKEVYKKDGADFLKILELDPVKEGLFGIYKNKPIICEYDYFDCRDIKMLDSPTNTFQYILRGSDLDNYDYINKVMTTSSHIFALSNKQLFAYQEGNHDKLTKIKDFDEMSIDKNLSAIDFEGEEILFLSQSSKGLEISKDNGNTWQSAQDGLGDTYIRNVFNVRGEIIGLTKSAKKAYKYDHRNNTWQKVELSGKWGKLVLN